MDPHGCMNECIVREIWKIKKRLADATKPLKKGLSKKLTLTVLCNLHVTYSVEPVVG
jgi:hypothetical protein